MTEAGNHHSTRRRHGRAAWTLMLLTLLCAELTFLAVALPIMWIIFPLLFPMYGAGVLLIRELVVRTGGGWPSLIIMGLVYELIEDGAGLQALTSQVLYAAPNWGARVLGINTTYWEAQAGYHIVFSVLIPVLITNLIFPELQRTPYLKRRGLIGTAVTAVIGVGLIRVTIAATQDPGYQAPWPFLAILLVIIVALSFLALRIIPRRFPSTPSSQRRPGSARVPGPMITGLGAMAGMLAFLFLLMPRESPAQEPAVGQGSWVFLSMALAAGLALAALLLLRRWSSASRWTDLHRIWLAGGALVGHTLFIVIVTMLHPVDQLTNVMALTTGPALIVLTIVALAWLTRRVRKRAEADSFRTASV